MERVEGHDFFAGATAPTNRPPDISGNDVCPACGCLTSWTRGGGAFRTTSRSAAGCWQCDISAIMRRAGVGPNGPSGPRGPSMFDPVAAEIEARFNIAAVEVPRMVERIRERDKTLTVLEVARVCTFLGIRIGDHLGGGNAGR